MAGSRSDEEEGGEGEYEWCVGCGSEFTSWRPAFITLFNAYGEWEEWHAICYARCTWNVERVVMRDDGEKDNTEG